MINKLQQGGQASQQEQALILFVQGLAQVLQADPQLIILIAQQNPKALQDAAQVYQQTQDMLQAAQTFVLASQLQTQAARHGAKLNYIKSLKHQCAEDEELYYFKKGGSIGCGCKKKEDGGEIEKAQNGTKTTTKFKNDYNSKKVKDSENDYMKGVADHKVRQTTPTKKKFLNDYSSERVRKSEEDYFKGTADHTRPGKKVEKKACGSKVVDKFKNRKNK